MAIIRFENVHKTYKGDFWKKQKSVVTDLSFEIEKETVTGFVGPNGAGKTTSMKMLLGLIRPTKGICFLKGISSDNKESRRSVGFVSEQPYFYRHLSVRESLMFSMKLKGINVNASEKEIERVLGLVELTGVKNKKMFNLSKGMQQRVNMAQALIGDPEIFIFDEPMSGLDPLGRLLFRSIFRELGDRKKTLFFSTHILEDIETVCDNILVLSKGRKEYFGNISDLLEKGTLGTDIFLSNASKKLKEKLSATGCNVIGKAEDIQIFVPKNINLKDTMEICYEMNSIPHSVNKRSASLESILYDREEGLVK